MRGVENKEADEVDSSKKIEKYELRFLWNSMYEEVPLFQKNNGSDEKVEVPFETMEKIIKKFEMQNKISNILHTPGISCRQAMWRILELKKMSKSHFCSITKLGEYDYRRIEEDHPSLPKKRTIVAFAIGLSIGLENTKKLLQLSGYAFSELLEEDQIFEYCQGADLTIDQCNELLKLKGISPLGAKQRL